jgi:hypothetical protein
VDKRFLRLATRVDSEDDSFSASGSLSMGCFSMWQGTEGKVYRSIIDSI